MFNVTVIRLKDIAKILLIVIAIYILSKFILKNLSLKEHLNKSINVNDSSFIKLGIDMESNIIKNISKTNLPDEKTEDIENNFKTDSLKSMLKIGLNLFNIEEAERSVGQEIEEKKEENNTDTNINSEEQKIAQTQDVNKDVNSEVITQNPIAEKYNKEYNGIKIKNETSYELTDDMLNPENLDIDKKNIIIFHTHTCESYTQTENYQYEPSRKLQNNKSKFFCCSCRG